MRVTQGWYWFLAVVSAAWYTPAFIYMIAKAIQIGAAAPTVLIAMAKWVLPPLVLGVFLAYARAKDNRLNGWKWAALAAIPVVNFGVLFYLGLTYDEHESSDEGDRRSRGASGCMLSLLQFIVFVALTFLFVRVFIEFGAAHDEGIYLLSTVPVIIVFNTVPPAARWLIGRTRRRNEPGNRRRVL